MTVRAALDLGMQREISRSSTVRVPPPPDRRRRLDMAKSKPTRVTCKRCGSEYTEGMPHSAFCHGHVPEGAACCECGFGDHDDLYECQNCGAILCALCKEESHEC